jgi:hypothetical protein
VQKSDPIRFVFKKLLIKFAQFGNLLYEMKYSEYATVVFDNKIFAYSFAH